MRRNCNLELRLLPSSASFLSADSTELPQRHHQNYSNMMEESSESPPSHSQQQHHHHQQLQQQLTIFYNGNICVCDVTEFQARAILFYASKEVEERLKTPTGNDQPCSPNVQSQMSSPTAGLSMKRSLQRFLQKRRHRVQATSPYHH